MDNKIAYPTISVITPSYNSGKYIEDAVNSVLAQNYPNFEHIIVDGGSTDNTLQILEKYPHLKWVSEPDNGQSDAMNKGFGMSSGEIIVYLNADDYFEPDAFSNIVHTFEKNPDADMIVGNLKITYDDGREDITGTVVIPITNRKTYQGGFGECLYGYEWYEYHMNNTDTKVVNDISKTFREDYKFKLNFYDILK